MNEPYFEYIIFKNILCDLIIYFIKCEHNAKVSTYNNSFFLQVNHKVRTIISIKPRIFHFNYYQHERKSS